MSGQIIDFAARRKGRVAPPQREPDVYLHAWFDKPMTDPTAEIDWVCTMGEFCVEQPGWSHKQQVATLIDAAWVYAGLHRDTDPRTAPAIWVILQQDGTLSYLYANSLIRGTDWRHGLWLLRFGFRIFRRMSALAWHATRGGRK